MKIVPKKAVLAGAAFRNLALGINAASLTLLAKPYNLVHYSSEARFLLRAMNRWRGVPEATIGQALGAPPQQAAALNVTGEAITWGGGVGSYTIDILSLCLACKLLEPKVYFEIGTLNGFTAYHAALNSPESARIYTLDLPPEGAGEVALHVTAIDEAHIKSNRKVEKLLFEGTPEEARITRLFGDSASFDYSPYHGQVDVFFIDGAHSYEYVRSDTLKALDCCHPGSMILWHDFGRVGVNGVSRWLHELKAAGGPVHVVPGASLAHMLVPKDLTALKNKFAEAAR